MSVAAINRFADNRFADTEQRKHSHTYGRRNSGSSLGSSKVRHFGKYRDRG